MTCNFLIQCPRVPEFLLSLNDLECFDTIQAEMTKQDRVTPDVVESYKFSYKDRSR